MDKVSLKAKMASGNGLTAEEQEHISAALETHDTVEEIMRRAQAFDWAGLFKNLIPNLLPFITSLIPGLGALGPILNLIFSLFKLPIPPLPVPNPTPNPADIIVPTPVP